MSDAQRRLAEVVREQVGRGVSMEMNGKAGPGMDLGVTSPAEAPHRLEPLKIASKCMEMLLLFKSLKSF